MALSGYKGMEKSYLCFEAYLGFIEEHCPLSFVRECYRRLRELLAWGYSFVLFRIKGEKPPQRVCRNYCTGRNASAAKAVPGICAHMEKAYGTGRMSIPKRYG